MLRGCGTCGSALVQFTPGVVADHRGGSAGDAWRALCGDEEVVAKPRRFRTVYTAGAGSLADYPHAALGVGIPRHAIEYGVGQHQRRLRAQPVSPRPRCARPSRTPRARPEHRLPRPRSTDPPPACARPPGRNRSLRLMDASQIERVNTPVRRRPQMRSSGRERSDYPAASARLRVVVVVYLCSVTLPPSTVDAPIGGVTLMRSVIVSERF
jgi:hypothetical protein